jgi:hypothetical protein
MIIWLTHVNIIRIYVRSASSLLCAFGGDFGWGKFLFRVKYNNKKLSHPFHSHWGPGWNGWQQSILDDVSFLGNIPNMANFDGFG